MTICKHCGTALDDGARFCWHCGSKQEAPAPAAEIPAEEPAPAPIEEAPADEPAEAPEPELCAAESIPAEEPEPELCTAESIPAEPSAPTEEAPAEEPAEEPVPEAIPVPVLEEFAPEPEPKKRRREKKVKAERPAPVPPAQEPAGTPRHRVVSVAGYFWTLFLLAIPALGLLLAAVWALGGTKRDNRKNLARAWLLLVLVALVILAAAYLVLQLAFPHIVHRITEVIVGLWEYLF